MIYCIKNIDKIPITKIIINNNKITKFVKLHLVF